MTIWFAHCFVPGPGYGLVCPVLSSRARACRRDHQAPSAPLPDVGVTFVRETLPPPAGTLLPGHRSYEHMCQSRLALLCFGSSPRSRSLCRLLLAPAVSGIFPTLSLRIFPVMPGPLPRRFADCSHLLLPLHHRPSPTMGGSACRFYPLKRLPSGRLFVDCSHSFMFRPHSLLATLVAPTTAVSCRAVSDFYIRAERALLPPHAPDMLAVRNR
jgi:hypothetical protein